MGRIILLGEENKPCDHDACVVSFDMEAAQNLSAYEIQQRWPRFEGNCPDCGQRIIKYASAAHYTSGDW